MSFADFVTANKSLLLERPEPKRKYTKNGESKNLKASPNQYVADFETTTKLEDNESHVWLWALVDINKAEYDEVEVGINLEDFMGRIQKENSTIYFHNLRFDGNFILPYLFRNGYTYCNRNDGTFPGTFETLISYVGQFYSITVHWKGGHRTEFRDSLKKLIFDAKTVAKTYELEYSKGEIDYHLDRPIGYEPTVDEIDYVKRDVLIIAQAMKQVIDSGMSSLTVASDALKEYKSLSGKSFSSRFPVLDNGMDAEIRRAYRGGFTYASPKYKQRKCGYGRVFDVNSLYPYIMRSRALPYGIPIFVEDEEQLKANLSRYPLYIANQSVTARLKPDHIPTVQIKGHWRYVPTDFIEVIDDITEITMTNVDWQLMEDHYDVTYFDFNGAWMFKSAYGMFNDYVDKWANVKATSKGGKREIAKLFMNSLYGKFATNPIVRSKVPEFVDDKVVYRSGIEEEKEPIYTPVACFITSYAREMTIRTGQKYFSYFAYADTDSLHFVFDDLPFYLDDGGNIWENPIDKTGWIGFPNDLNVHPTELGAWKHEYDFIEALYVRAKFYSEKTKSSNIHKDDCDNGCEIRHDYVTRIAGLPTRLSNKLTFDEMYHGNVIHGKLVPKIVHGGTILVETDYTFNFND